MNILIETLSDMKKITENLNQTLIKQFNNPLFYEGNVNEGAKELTKEVSLTLDCDRCSIWLYNKDRTSIVCQQLYIKSENSWYQDIELSENDFKPYFDYLTENDIIVAVKAKEHPATSCFTEVYLNPLGIESMLDIPIYFKGQIIGVICIENFSMRSWKEEEIDFAKILASLYTFVMYSSENIESEKKIQDASREVNKKNVEIINRMNAINHSNAVIEFDLSGNIIFCNDKFSKLLGYTFDEIKGHHHSMFVDPTYKKSDDYIKFWNDIKQGDYFSGEVHRVKKDGNFIHLQATYNPIYDVDGKVYRIMKIAVDITEVYEKRKELEKKNTYLEHAAKILRHDMHSGINTYIPRGISALERKLTEDDIKNFKIEAPLKMIRDGLKHAQKVYKGVYEFTNLVKKDVCLSKTDCNIKNILSDYLSTTSYKSQVLLDDNLPTIMVNESLFCTSLDNLIRNGLKYNDSPTKFVKIYLEKDIDDHEFICVEDNGRGINQSEFEHLSKPYVRKEGQKETGTGLGLNICIAILSEHGFSITAQKLSVCGTKLRIRIS